MSRPGSGILLSALGLAALAASCGGVDDRPARWTYIHPAIIEPSCATASCHSGQAKAAAVNLATAKDGYCALVGGGTTGCARAGFVHPGLPIRSKLLYLLRADEVRRMPRDAPLPDADIDLIERWILAGATND